MADVVRAAGGMPLAYLVNSVWGSYVLVVPRDTRAEVRAVFVPEVTSASIVRLLTLGLETAEPGLLLVQDAGTLTRRRELPRVLGRLRRLARSCAPRRAAGGGSTARGGRRTDRAAGTGPVAGRSGGRGW
ncbi:hypothetical protein NKH77_51920 [Streptomyces sp. M19]